MGTVHGAAESNIDLATKRLPRGYNFKGFEKEKSTFGKLHWRMGWFLKAVPGVEDQKAESQQLQGLHQPPTLELRGWTPSLGLVTCELSEGRASVQRFAEFIPRVREIFSMGLSYMYI